MAANKNFLVQFKKVNKKVVEEKLLLNDFRNERNLFLNDFWK